MPQATDELRNKMRERFGSIGVEGPYDFLSEAGYTSTADYLWEPKPGVKSYGDMTQDELDCLDFLIEEWDYGGLVEDRGPSTGAMHAMPHEEKLKTAVVVEITPKEQF